MTLPTRFQILFATFPPLAGDVRAQLEAYATAIAGHDERDINAAIDMIIRGEAVGHNPAFAPSAAQVGSAIRQCMNARLDTEARSKVYLPPPELPPPDPESVARVQALINKAVESLTDKGL